MHGELNVTGNTFLSWGETLITKMQINLYEEKAELDAWGEKLHLFVQACAGC